MNPIDTSLLEGENPDILEESREVAGEEWLNEKNIRLGLITPLEAIGQGKEFLVRDILRSTKYSSFS